METVLLRAGSVPIMSPALCSSPKVSLSRQSSVGTLFSGERAGSSPCSPIMSLQFPKDKRKPKKETRSSMRRAFSETDLSKSESLISGGSPCFPAGIPEEEYLSDADSEFQFRTSMAGSVSDQAGFAPIWPEFGISMDEIGFSGEEIGNGGKFGGDHADASCGDKRKIGDYYREMLKINPCDSLLLRNYGKYLQEVEKDTERAEEYYGRAILAGPADGEVLSLYGKLIWDKHRDESRAKYYFEQAVAASSDDCMVLGSYAEFMWEAEEDEEEEEEMMMVSSSTAKVGCEPTMAAAYNSIPLVSWMFNRS